MIRLNNLNEIIKSITLRFIKEQNITKNTNIDLLYSQFIHLINEIYLLDEFIIEYLNLICEISSLSKEEFFEEMNRSYFVKITDYKKITSEIDFINYVRNEIKLYCLIRIPLHKLIYSSQTKKSKNFYDHVIFKMYSALPSFNFYYLMIYLKQQEIYSYGL